MQVASDTIDRETFGLFADLIYREAGIRLNQQKTTLVSTRLMKRMRRLNIDEFRTYYDVLSRDETGDELMQLLNVISTNTTHFFRENPHFEFLKTEIAGLADKGQQTIRIWCAASSTGEEPYSLAITAQESMSSGQQCRILATDISTDVLKRARMGRYVEKAAEDMPAHILLKYFRREKDNGIIEANASLKRMIKFARLNLSQSPYNISAPLDFIFCRNVMIYFDAVVRDKLFSEFTRILKPGGFLIVGHAESNCAPRKGLRLLRSSIYQKALSGEY